MVVVMVYFLFLWPQKFCQRDSVDPSTYPSILPQLWKQQQQHTHTHIYFFTGTCLYWYIDIHRKKEIEIIIGREKGRETEVHKWCTHTRAPFTKTNESSTPLWIAWITPHFFCLLCLSCLVAIFFKFQVELESELQVQVSSWLANLQTSLSVSWSPICIISPHILNKSVAKDINWRLKDYCLFSFP